VQREAELKDEKQYLHAEIRGLKQRLFGRKAETSSAADPKSQAAISGKQPDGQRRRRGHQPGAKGHGRRNHNHLPAKDEPCILPEDQRCCPYCQEPFEEIPGTADGDILECEVRGYRRRYHRQRYRRRCRCPQQPAVVTAPPPAKLIPKSNLGISLWVLLLVRKFQFFQPLYRILAELESCGLSRRWHGD